MKAEEFFMNRMRFWFDDPRMDMLCAAFTGERDTVWSRFKFIWEWSEVDSVEIEAHDDYAKSAEESETIRQLGNDEFRDRNYEKACCFYTRAIQLAPQPCPIASTAGSNGAPSSTAAPATVNNEQLALALGNRSVAHYYCNMHHYALADIDVALESGYPREQQFKLYQRKAMCYEALGDHLKAKVAYGVAVGMCGDGKQQAVIVKQRKEFEKKCAKKIKAAEAAVASGDGRRARRMWREVPALADGPNAELPVVSSAVTWKENVFFAKRNIDPGEVLLCEAPSAFCPSKQMQLSHCSNCATLTAISSFPCRQCALVVYCSIGCEREAWDKFHRVECRILPRIAHLSLILQSSIDRITGGGSSNRSNSKVVDQQPYMFQLALRKMLVEGPRTVWNAFLEYGDAVRFAHGSAATAAASSDRGPPAVLKAFREYGDALRSYFGTTTSADESGDSGSGRVAATVATAATVAGENDDGSALVAATSTAGSDDKKQMLNMLRLLNERLDIGDVGDDRCEQNRSPGRRALKWLKMRDSRENDGDETVDHKLSGEENVSERGSPTSDTTLVDDEEEAHVVRSLEEVSIGNEIEKVVDDESDLEFYKIDQSDDDDDNDETFCDTNGCGCDNEKQVQRQRLLSEIFYAVVVLKLLKETTFFDELWEQPVDDEWVNQSADKKVSSAACKSRNGENISACNNGKRGTAARAHGKDGSGDGEDVVENPLAAKKEDAKVKEELSINGEVSETPTKGKKKLFSQPNAAVLFDEEDHTGGMTGSALRKDWSGVGEDVALEKPLASRQENAKPKEEPSNNVELSETPAKGKKKLLSQPKAAVLFDDDNLAEAHSPGTTRKLGDLVTAGQRSQFEVFVGVHLLLESELCNFRTLQMMEFNVTPAKPLPLCIQELSVGPAVFTMTSLIRNACDPNVARVIHGRTSVVRALRTIHTGEELRSCIGSHYTHRGVEQRQEESRKLFGYECDCRACAENWPPSVDRVLLVCPDCRGKLPAVKGGNHWCDTCGKDQWKKVRHAQAEFRDAKRAFDAAAHEFRATGCRREKQLTAACDYVKALENVVHAPSNDLVDAMLCLNAFICIHGNSY